MCFSVIFQLFLLEAKANVKELENSGHVINNIGWQQTE